VCPLIGTSWGLYIETLEGRMRDDAHRISWPSIVVHVCNRIGTPSPGASIGPALPSRSFVYASTVTSRHSTFMHAVGAPTPAHPLVQLCHPIHRCFMSVGGGHGRTVSSIPLFPSGLPCLWSSFLGPRAELIERTVASFHSGLALST
jgi:hypothetical protein